MEAAMERLPISKAFTLIEPGPDHRVPPHRGSPHQIRCLRQLILGSSPRMTKARESTSTPAGIRGVQRQSQPPQGVANDRPAAFAGGDVRAFHRRYRRTKPQFAERPNTCT